MIIMHPDECGGSLLNWIEMSLYPISVGWGCAERDVVVAMFVLCMRVCLCRMNKLNLFPNSTLGKCWSRLKVLNALGNPFRDLSSGEINIEKPLNS